MGSSLFRLTEVANQRIVGLRKRKSYRYRKYGANIHEGAAVIYRAITLKIRIHINQHQASYGGC